MRLWTESELKILHNSKNIIPEIKGRSRNAVRDKMVQLGLLKTNKHWSVKEIALIKRGALEIEGRTKLAVRLKRMSLGLTKSPRWKKEEIELLKNKRNVPGRSINGIREKLTRLGLRKKRMDRPDWTEENLNKLKELHSLGNSARDIFNMGIFNCSQNAIQKKLCRLGVTKKLKIFKFPEEIRNKFKKFLVENWKGKTPRDLCEIWNKENAQYPTNVLRVVSYLDKLGIKIPYDEVQKINNLRKREKELNLANKKSASDLLEQIRMERIKLMQGRIAKNRDIWTGLPLPCGIDMDLNA